MLIVLNTLEHLSKIVPSHYDTRDGYIEFCVFEFGHIMMWHPVKVQLPLSINICVVHVLPLLPTQLVCVTGVGLCFQILITSCFQLKGFCCKHTDYQWTLLLKCQSATSDKLTGLNWQVGELAFCQRTILRCEIQQQAGQN